MLSVFGRFNERGGGGGGNLQNPLKLRAKQKGFWTKGCPAFSRIDSIFSNKFAIHHLFIRSFLVKIYLFLLDNLKIQMKLPPVPFIPRYIIIHGNGFNIGNSLYYVRISWRARTVRNI